MGYVIISGRSGAGKTGFPGPTPALTCMNESKYSDDPIGAAEIKDHRENCFNYKKEELVTKSSPQTDWEKRMAKIEAFLHLGHLH